MVHAPSQSNTWSIGGDKPTMLYFSTCLTLAKAKLTENLISLELN